MASLTEIVGLLLVSGVLFFAGFASIRTAFVRRKQRNLVEETPTEEVESLSLGQSEVKGTAHPAGPGTMPAPFSNEECLVAEWRIEEYDVTTDSEGDEDGSWDHLASGVEHVPFYVDDGTGRLLIRPDDRATFDIDEESEERLEIDVSGSTPEYVRSFENEHDIREPRRGERHMGHREGDRRYYQNLIQPGEDAYVFGVVRSREDAPRSSANEENLVVEHVPEGDEDLQDMFMISDRSEEEIIESRKYAILYFPLGALLATGGLGVLLFLIGKL